MTRGPMTLADLFSSGDTPEEKKILPEARIMRLREEFDRFGKNTFKPGDIVTALPTAMVKWVGIPMIVLETKEPELVWTEDPGSSHEGWRPSVRCAHLVNGGEHIVRHWYEAEDLELYPYLEESHG